MSEQSQLYSNVEIISTTCASHCGGACILKLHVKDGVIIHIETDDADECEGPQLRGCLRGRAYRQRVYAPDRILHPLKRVGERGEGKFERISLDEALETVGNQLIRVRDTYGPESILYLSMGGDLHNLHNSSQMAKMLSMAGGFTAAWGTTSFQGGMYAQKTTYGTMLTANTRDDLVNSRLIIMWGWNPANTITGVNTSWFLAQTKEKGAKIVSVDPRYSDSTATFAHQWIAIRPGTDGAMLLAMAFVMIKENIHDREFLDKYCFGFDQFKEYVTGVSDGIAKTPEWAKKITSVPTEIIEQLARDYATISPAALIAGIAPGRTANGEQYHRIAITLAAMTGNVGIHGGDAAGRSWESLIGGVPYRMAAMGAIGNPVDAQAPRPPRGSPPWYRASRVHYCDVPDFILNGKANGYPANCKLIAMVNCNYVDSFPNINRTTKALKSEKLEFCFIQEQFMTSTARYADIIFPNNTYMERNDIANGVGMAYYGSVNQAIVSLGESRSHLEIASLLADKMQIDGFSDKTEEEWLRELVKNSEIPDYDEFRKQGVYRFKLTEPLVAFQNQVEDPDNNPFPTPSGKIEIFSQQWADLDQAELSPIPQYVETWESVNDPLIEKYPLQMITSHMKRRANSQFDNIPWLRELEPQAVLINSKDAQSRGLKDRDMVRVYNDRGEIRIMAKVTERIMPGVVDVPTGAWYTPDGNGIDQGGNPNVLTKETYSPGGSYAYNTCLVQVEKG